MFSRLLVATLIALLCACGPLMLRSEKSEGPHEGGALITFLHPFEVGKKGTFDLWDGDQFIGKLSSGTLIEWQAGPGEHYFMAKAANWSVVKATLTAGERYYVIARPAMSGLEVAVVLEPATLTGEASDLTKWLSRLKPVAAEPEKALEHTSYHANEARKIRRKAKAGEIYVRVIE